MSIKKTNIETKELTVGYDKMIVIPNFNASFVKGEITSIIGANGCGKSTILKAIGRIIPKNQGTIIINDIDSGTLKSKEIAKMLAILPQSPRAPGTLTVRELVSFGRFPYQKGLGKLTREDKEIVDWALEKTDLREYADREIMYLSGGERQKVWIAMALSQKTDIILLDEPTTYLDLCHQLEVLELLKRLNEESGVTIVMVLHDLNLASRYSDRLLAMRNGAIYKIGKPEEVFTAKMLQDCFGVEGNIEMREGKPLCVSYKLSAPKKDEGLTFLKEGEAALSRKDYSRALRLFKKASELGVYLATYNLACMHYFGDGMAKDLEKSFALFVEASKQGDVEALNRAGMVALELGQKDEAHHYLKLASEKGSVGGIYNYAMLIIDDDREEGLKQLKLAAEKGNGYAYCTLGKLYEKGEILPKNIEEAVHCYEKAASLRVNEAEAKLAECYAKGLFGYPKDRKKSKYYRKLSKTPYED